VSYLSLEALCDHLEERLRRCIRRRRARRIHRMAKLARLGADKGVFSPKRLWKETGMRYNIVYMDIHFLLRLGVIERIRWGRYRIAPGIKVDELEEEITKRILRRLVGERPRRQWIEEEEESARQGEV
jgi:hypothetical protein